MTAHKHAELIKAKADNVGLVVFCRLFGRNYWHQIEHIALPKFETENEYFLCHPKHEKECLHWLNGGDIEMKALDGFTYHCPYNRWGVLHVFMRENFDFRIKPRKEKRWIGIYDRRFVTQPPVGTLQEVQELVLSSSEYRNCAPEGWQFIEIEVEV